MGTKGSGTMFSLPSSSILLLSQLKYGKCILMSSTYQVSFQLRQLYLLNPLSVIMAQTHGLQLLANLLGAL